MGDYNFTFLRHAQSFGNKENYFQGQSDTPLTEAGLCQVQRLIGYWQEQNRQFTQVICSPLTRARTTAEMIANAFNLLVEVDPLWLERDTGKLTQLDREVAREMPFFNEYYTPFMPMGETGEGDWHLFMRACKGLDNLLSRPKGAYLVVSHGGLLNQVLRAIAGVVPQPISMGVVFHLDNTGYATVSLNLSDYRWIIRGLNDTHHLD